MVLGGCCSGVWVDSGIGWRRKLRGRVKGIYVHSGLFGGAGSKKGDAGSNSLLDNRLFWVQ